MMRMSFFQNIFQRVRMLLLICRSPLPVENKKQYNKALLWNCWAIFLYTVATIIAAVVIVDIVNNPAKYLNENEQARLIESYIAYTLVSLFTAWAVSTIVLYFRLFIGWVFRASFTGFLAGEMHRTVVIDDEVGGLTARTETKGCAFAIINTIINVWLWILLSEFVCPILTVIRICKTTKNIRLYQQAQKMQ